MREESAVRAYADLKDRHQREFDHFSADWCFHAFNSQQFEEGLAKLKPNMAEDERVVRFGAGCFCPKSKVDKLASMTERHCKELRHAMRDRDFATAAFFYEMENHEYSINWQGDWDVVSCFYSVGYEEDATGDDYLLRAGAAPETRAAYAQARREYFRMAEEREWF